MRVTLKNSMHYIIWAQGVFWSIIGLMFGIASSNPLSIIPMWIATWLLMFLLTWIARVIAQVTRYGDVAAQFTVPAQKGAVRSPYYRSLRF